MVVKYSEIGTNGVSTEFETPCVEIRIHGWHVSRPASVYVRLQFGCRQWVIDSQVKKDKGFVLCIGAKSVDKYA